MEESSVTDTGQIILKGNTPLCLRLLQLIECLEATIGERLVRERPQALAGLQFW